MCQPIMAEQQPHDDKQRWKVYVHDNLVHQRTYHVVQTVTMHVITVNINLITACSLLQCT